MEEIWMKKEGLAETIGCFIFGLLVIAGILFIPGAEDVSIVRFNEEWKMGSDDMKVHLNVGSFNQNLVPYINYVHDGENYTTIPSNSIDRPAVVIKSSLVQMLAKTEKEDKIITMQRMYDGFGDISTMYVIIDSEYIFYSFETAY